MNLAALVAVVLAIHLGGAGVDTSESGSLDALSHGRPSGRWVLSPVESPGEYLLTGGTGETLAVQRLPGRDRLYVISLAPPEDRESVSSAVAVRIPRTLPPPGVLPLAADTPGIALDSLVPLPQDEGDTGEAPEGVNSDPPAGAMVLHYFRSTREVTVVTGDGSVTTILRY